ncbi:MAG: lactate utilization protein [Thermodesulfobacteriota bacterium]|nr:lactate utilization protein [Thermodesulfobacteriota bacterium]
MKNPIGRYWRVRLNDVKKQLEANNFEAYVAENAAKARQIVLEEIVPKIGAKSVSWGGSLTFVSSGLYDVLKDDRKMKVLDVFDKERPREQTAELRRQALLVDLFITGTNAVTETGKLVNLDMYGNRVAAITFGPKYVVILVGRNKIVADVEEAMVRIRNYAAPVNAMRLDKKTPCIKTSYCEDCRSPDRICNTWTISEKSFPKGRIKVVLINRDMGF